MTHATKRKAIKRIETLIRDKPLGWEKSALILLNELGKDAEYAELAKQLEAEGLAIQSNGVIVPSN